MPITHTPECKRTQAIQTETLKEWRERWPGYCGHCSGWGQFSYPATYEDPGGADPCDDCVGSGKCGRCGTTGLPEEGPCSKCGWNYDDGLPQIDDWCDCGAPTEEEWAAATLIPSYPEDCCQGCGKPEADPLCNDCLRRSDEAHDAARERRRR